MGISRLAMLDEGSSLSLDGLESLIAGEGAANAELLRTPTCFEGWDTTNERWSKYYAYHILTLSYHNILPCLTIFHHISYYLTIL